MSDGGPMPADGDDGAGGGAARRGAADRARALLGSLDGGKVPASVLSDGPPAVEAACQEAPGEGVHSAGAIHHTLSR